MEYFYEWEEIECLREVEESQGYVCITSKNKSEAIRLAAELHGRTEEEKETIIKALSSVEPEVSVYDAPL